MMYQIDQKIIVGLPNVPFRYGSYEGIAVHCTDSPNHSGGDTPTNEQKYESGTYNNAFVHFFIGVENNQPKIIQVAPISSGAYGAGYTANRLFLHLELCMYDDSNLFKMAYDAYIWLCAKLLHDKGLGVTDKGSVWSHKEISDTWKETTHQDPIEYLAYHGITWDKFISDVKGAYADMDTVWINFLTGGYSGDSLVKIHNYLLSTKWFFTPTRKDDGTLNFLIGGFEKGSDSANTMEKFLKDNGYWYAIK
jgi:N-acetylmuramoyl-L-alanine amidase CwlA